MLHVRKFSIKYTYSSSIILVKCYPRLNFIGCKSGAENTVNAAESSTSGYINLYQYFLPPRGTCATTKGVIGRHRNWANN